MNWLHSCFGSIYCRTRVDKFNIQHNLVLECKWRNSIHRGRIISSLKACKMISKGCLYHIVRVQDLDSEIPPIESVLIERELPEVFPNYLPSFPSEWEIVFFVDLLPNTNCISNPPYRMAYAEMKELKDQLYDLLDIGLIIPFICPWDALDFFW